MVLNGFSVYEITGRKRKTTTRNMAHSFHKKHKGNAFNRTLLNGLCYIVGEIPKAERLGRLGMHLNLGKLLLRFELCLHVLRL